MVLSGYRKIEARNVARIGVQQSQQFGDVSIKIAQVQPDVSGVSSHSGFFTVSSERSHVSLWMQLKDAPS